MLDEGDPDETTTLVAGLLLQPWSLFRASYYKDNPPVQGKATRELSWYGNTQEAQLLATLTNMLAGKRVILPPTTSEVAAGENFFTWMDQVIASQHT